MANKKLKGGKCILCDKPLHSHDVNRAQVIIGKVTKQVHLSCFLSLPTEANVK